MTVFGEPIALPKLEAPRPEDVDKWHATYVEVRADDTLRMLIFDAGYRPIDGCDCVCLVCIGLI